MDYLELLLNELEYRFARKIFGTWLFGWILNEIPQLPITSIKQQYLIYLKKTEYDKLLNFLLNKSQWNIISILDQPDYFCFCIERWFSKQEFRHKAHDYFQKSK